MSARLAGAIRSWLTARMVKRLQREKAAESAQLRRRLVQNNIAQTTLVPRKRSAR